MNLTAVRDLEDAWMRHALDSLLLLPHLKEDAGRRVIDLGSGGGLPAIPLAICRPDLRFTLVESTKKKAAFLSSVAEELELKNVEVCAERAEALARNPSYREEYHLATARAVASLPVLVELTLPFMKKGGTFLAMKGEKAPEEIKAARVALERLNARVLRTEPKTGGGHLVLIKKVGPTHKKYPRPVGIPNKMPLV